MGDRADDSELMEIALWRRLVTRACRTGISLVEAQDLASRSILLGLESFDPSRGSFQAFCLTIHSNLVKNHHRDRKITVEFDPDCDERTVPDDPLQRIEDEETSAMMRDLAERILAELDPVEAAFFLTLGDVMRTIADGAVSEASRRSGLPPSKGWDIFRRIQRKARKHAPEFEEFPPTAASDELVCAAPLPESAPPAPSGLSMGRDTLLLSAGAAVAGFDRFAAGLSRVQREQLAAYLG